MATPIPISLAAVTPAPALNPADNTELVARKKAFYEALYAQSAVDEPAPEPSPAPVQEPAPPPATLPTPEMSPSPRNPNSLGIYTGTKDRWALNTQLEKPPTPYILRTGWVIPALLLSGMESELPGTIIAQVSQDVYDTPRGRYLLIPQGSRLVGEYANSIAYGQSRIFVAWERIIYPDGSALDIGAMPGVDAIGEAGFHDQVNNHYLRIFGSALLMSAITGGIAISQPNYNGNSAPNASSTLSSALGQQLGAATSTLLERNLSIPPTLTIRQGYAFNVVVVKDLTFERAYDP
jgi:type IV secretion system protein VirB10